MLTLLLLFLIPLCFTLRWHEHFTKDYQILSTRLNQYEVVRLKPQLQQPLINHDHTLLYHRDELIHSHLPSIDEQRTSFKLLHSHPHQQRVYFYDKSYDKPIRAAYTIVIKNNDMSEHKQAIVDVETGRLLRTIPLMHTFDAPALVFKQPASLQPEEVIFRDLIDQRPGIRGSWERTANNCPYYTCDPLGNSTRNSAVCDVEDVICFDGPDLGSIVSTTFLARFTQGEVPNIHQASVNTSFSGKLITLQRDWLAEGFKDGYIHLKLTGLPVIGGRITFEASNGFKGAWKTPYNASDKLDSFPESQIYYLAQEWFSFIKSKMTQEFCQLSQHQYDCHELNSTLFNINGNLSAGGFDGPFLMATNILQAPLELGSIFTQLARGLGKSFSNPIVLDMNGRMQPYENAFFYFNPQNLTLDQCQEGNCLSNSGQPRVPMMGFGQGRRDWALDHCIAYHEMMHAVTNRLLPWLASTVRSRFGSSTDPGAMNEAWSDYWAAIKCGNANLGTSYVGIVKRNMDNDFKVCGEDGTFVNGQIHHDSQVFSGALWQVRKSIPASVKEEFDEAVLVAEALASDEETFRQQFDKILMLMRNGPLSDHAPEAERIFNERDNCVYRLFPLDVRIHSIQLPAVGDSGTVDYAASPVQFTLTPDNVIGLVDSKRISINWQQKQRDPNFGVSNFGYSALPLSFVYSWDCPIYFDYVNGTSLPKSACTNQTLEIQQARAAQSTLDFLSAVYTGVATIERPPLGKTVYFFLLHSNPVDMNLDEISARPTWQSMFLIIIIVVSVFIILAGVVVFNKLMIKRQESQSSYELRISTN